MSIAEVDEGFRKRLGLELKWGGWEFNQMTLVIRISAERSSNLRLSFIMADGVVCFQWFVGIRTAG